MDPTRELVHIARLLVSNFYANDPTQVGDWLKRLLDKNARGLTLEQIIKASKKWSFDEKLVRQVVEDHVKWSLVARVKEKYILGKRLRKVDIKNWMFAVLFDSGGSLSEGNLVRRGRQDGISKQAIQANLKALLGKGTLVVEGKNIALTGV